jgi:transcription initiation factor TFIID subunit 11
MMSTTSTASTHPLRQTSFPPEVTTHTPAFSRSPSIDTMSLVSGSVTGPKKKRPRKSKGGGKGDDESINGGGARAKSAISGEGGRGVSVEEEEDDGDHTALATVANTNEETQKEKTKLALLTQSFDEDQWKRYEAWRSSKLSDAVVRRVCCPNPLLRWKILLIR